MVTHFGQMVFNLDTFFHNSQCVSKLVCSPNGCRFFAFSKYFLLRYCGFLFGFKSLRMIPVWVGVDTSRPRDYPCGSLMSLWTRVSMAKTPGGQGNIYLVSPDYGRFFIKMTVCEHHFLSPNGLPACLLLISPPILHRFPRFGARFHPLVRANYLELCNTPQCLSFVSWTHQEHLDLIPIGPPL
jgi:hypothetical protein